MKATYLDLIRHNRRASLVLGLAMVALLATAGAAFGGAYGVPLEGSLVALVLAGALFLFSWYGGAGTVLLMSGARPIAKADHPQLFNVVEELAIAAGLPMPRVYIIDDDVPNAFATGRDPAHASLAITRGLLERLDRDELQGVMAHELAHVRHYDIRFAMLMAVMAGAVVLLSDLFLRLAFHGGLGRGRPSSSNRRGGRGGGGGKGQLLLVLIALVLAVLAPLFATLIRLAVSRRREYLADAGAVELTRYPDGLARALEKLTAAPGQLARASRATQHLYIVNPLKGQRLGADHLFSTHPPLAQRIARLRALGAATAPA